MIQSCGKYPDEQIRKEYQMQNTENQVTRARSRVFSFMFSLYLALRARKTNGKERTEKRKCDEL